MLLVKATPIAAKKAYQQQPNMAIVHLIANDLSDNTQEAAKNIDFLI